jgi:site-specific DNA recombinase
MGPTFTRKNGKTYRYYLCVHASKNGYSKCPVRTVAAGEIEEAVVGQLRAVFRSPELIAQTFRGAKSRESEELERLRRERTELEDRLRVLKEMAARLLQREGNGGGAIAEDLRRSGDEIDDVKRQLEVVAAEVGGLEAHVLTEREVIEALERLDPVWEELFPGEQTRIVQLLVERVEVGPEGLAVRLRGDGLRSLVAEIGAGREREVEATVR